MMSFRKFIRTMLKVGFLGFGGGSALIPVMQEKFLEEEHLDTMENFNRDIVAASITPGALPVEIAGSLGRRNFGRKGMIAGALTMALPGAVCALLLFTLLSAVQSGVLTIIKVISVGISAFIIFLLVHYIMSVLRECRQESRDRLCKAVAVICGVFVLAGGSNLFSILGIDRTPIFSVSTIHILMAAFFVAFFAHGNYSVRNVLVCVVLCGIYLLGHGKAGLPDGDFLLPCVEILMVLLAVFGAVQSVRRTRWTFDGSQKGECLKDLAVWAVFLLVLSMPAVLSSWKAVEFIGRGLLSSFMSFGGGDAYLTIAEGLFVDSGMISSETYYSQIVALVNILPGSILCKTLLGIGFYLGYGIDGSVLTGVSFAVAGFACSIAASCSVFGVVYYMYESLRNSSIFRIIGRWIRPIIAGLLINIMLSLYNQSISVQQYTGASQTMIFFCTFGMVAVDYCLNRFLKLRKIWLLPVNLLAALLLL